MYDVDPFSVIEAGSMVMDVVYFNRVECAPYWYTKFAVTTVVEVQIMSRLCCQLGRFVEVVRR